MAVDLSAKKLSYINRTKAKVHELVNTYQDLRKLLLECEAMDHSSVLVDKDFQNENAYMNAETFKEAINYLDELLEKDADTRCLFRIIC
jgi:tetratricopeptide (TPR) repeat protein